MQPRRVLITGARGRIGTVLRPALRDGLEELRLSDLSEPDDLVSPETFVAADLTDQAAVQAAVDGVDAVVHLGAVPTETAFEAIAGPNLHGAFHVFEACRRAGVRRVVYASSNHATGMYAPGEPLDGAQPPRPDGLYGASKVWGEALGRLYVDKFGLEVVCLRIGSFQPRPRERRELRDLAQPRRRHPALPGLADRRRRRLRDRLRRLGQHAPLVAGRRAGRLRPAGRRGGLRGRARRPDYDHQGGPFSLRDAGGWAT